MVTQGGGQLLEIGFGNIYVSGDGEKRDRTRSGRYFNQGQDSIATSIRKIGFLYHEYKNKIIIAFMMKECGHQVNEELRIAQQPKGPADSA